MDESKTRISGASSYREIGEYWDRHDLADHWDETSEVQLDVDIRSSAIYFPVEKSVAERLRSAAESRGVSAEALLDEWLRERIGAK